MKSPSGFVGQIHLVSDQLIEFSNSSLCVTVVSLPECQTGGTQSTPEVFAALELRAFSFLAGRVILPCSSRLSPADSDGVHGDADCVLLNGNLAFLIYSSSAHGHARNSQKFLCFRVW